MFGENSRTSWNIVLPFGFNVSISAIQNQFNIMKNGSNVAGLSTVHRIICLLIGILLNCST